MPTIQTRATHPEVVRIFQQLVGSVAGHGDPHGVAQGLQLRCGNVLLSKIQQAFVVKSRGGTGEDGITWKPLARATIAQRRIGKGDLASIGIKGAGQPKNRVRGLLTKSEDATWRKIFATRKAWLMVKFGLSSGEASARAASIAWATLKAGGAATKLNVLGGRQVDILRDTGELFRSFAAGVDAAPSNAEGQVLRTPPGQVIVGTNKKPWHHKTRPFWPPDGNLPAPWWNAILLALRRGISEAAARILAG